MANLNRVLVKQGYAPIAIVAEALSKHRTTIHRMALQELFKSQLDGHACYIELSSLKSHYMNQNNKPMVEAIEALAVSLKRDVYALEARDKRASEKKSGAPPKRKAP